MVVCDLHFVSVSAVMKIPSRMNITLLTLSTSGFTGEFEPPSVVRWGTKLKIGERILRLLLKNTVKMVNAPVRPLLDWQLFLEPDSCHKFSSNAVSRVPAVITSFAFYLAAWDGTAVHESSPYLHSRRFAV